MSMPTTERKLRTFLADRKGTTTIEYGLIAAFVVLAFVGALSFYSQQVAVLFNTTVQAVLNM